MTRVQTTDDMIHDLSLVKVLLAAFEGSPEKANIMEELRQRCRYSMSVRLSNKIQDAKQTATDGKVDMRPGNLYQRAMALKHDAAVSLKSQLLSNYRAALTMVKAYGLISEIISVLKLRLLRCRTVLRYHLCLMDRAFSATDHYWDTLDAMNPEASLALDELNSKFEEMKWCLEEWHDDFLQTLEKIGRSTTSST